MYKIQSSILGLIHKPLLVLLFLVVGLSEVWAQPKTNSPLSILGIGDYLPQNYAPMAGIGGLTAAYSDPYNLNVHNPASLSRLMATTFAAGVYSQVNGWSGDNQGTENRVWAGNLSYLGLGFPLKNPVNEVLDRKKSPIRLGMSFSLAPYTSVGYQLVDYEYQEQTDSIRYNFTGDGSTYRLTWGNSIKYKDVSFGVNLGYLFGTTTFRRQATFDNVSNSYVSRYNNELSLKGFLWSAGVLYDYHFKVKNDKGDMVNSGKKITFGFYGNSNTSFSTNSTEEIIRGGLTVDTFLNNANVEQKGVLPAEWAFGIMYEHAFKFRFGADVKFSNWSKFEIGDTKETLKNSFRVALGGEYIPDHVSYNSYVKKIRYRIGIYYNKDPRFVGDFGQYKDYGLSIGFGLPLILPRQQTSFINLAVEAGKQGIDNYYSSNYARISLGFTLNDNRWFFKRKFN